MSLSWDDQTGVIVVADDPAAAAAAEAAVATAGARLLSRVSWTDITDRIERQIAPVILLADATGVSEEQIAHVLPDIIAAVGPTRTIAIFSRARIDQFGAQLLGTGATLLCDPTAADRVAAVIVALTGEGAHVSDSREEAVRLARINAEVTRFTETLAQLTAAAQGSDAAAERTAIRGDRAGPLDNQPAGNSELAAAELRRAIRARRLRDEVFGLPGLFEDPAWDMLLDLYAAHLERRQVSVSSLCIAAAVAPTTALRWINKLIAIGLFERRPDAFDRRRAYIGLTARAVQALTDYGAALRRTGLSIA